MTTITPELMNAEQMNLNQQSSEQPSITAFKEMIEEISCIDPHLAEEEEEQKECIISVFELPRAHFVIPEEEEQQQDATEALCAPVYAPSAMLAAAVDQTSCLSAVPMPVQVQQLFEKMAETMLVLHATGESETTLHLDAPSFQNSLFYGTKITIKEFSTAPKVFNIEIASSSLALQQIDLHKASLLTAFANGNFNFSVGRLDTEIKTDDRPLFHRKEAVSEDQEDKAK